MPSIRSKRVLRLTWTRIVPRSASFRRKRFASRLTETTFPSNSRRGARAERVLDQSPIPKGSTWQPTAFRRECGPSKHPIRCI
jgi:hypothetical protein